MKKTGPLVPTRIEIGDTGGGGRSNLEDELDHQRIVWKLYIYEMFRI